jgi:predicted nucleotidyltransferase
VSPDVLKLLADAVPDLCAVYLFGSRARGDSHRASDHDLAFLAARPLDALARWELQERVAAALGTDVDLVDLRRASAVLRARVVTEGEVVMEPRPTARSWFEMVALADYARLNEERAGILEDVRRTGRVHG